jgi:hypothetical protein
MGSHVVGPVPLRDLVEQCFNQGARFDTLAKTLQTKKLDKDFRENMLVAVAKGEDKMIEKMVRADMIPPLFHYAMKLLKCIYSV